METLLLRLFKSFSLRQQIKVREVTVCSSSPTYRVKHVPKKYPKKHNREYVYKVRETFISWCVKMSLGESPYMVPRPLKD